MNVVALVESESHVCCRYRLAAFRPALEQAGHTFSIRAIPPSWMARVAFYRQLRSADLVIVQRRLLPRWEVALLRRWVRRLAFDFDDAVWLRDSYSRRGFESTKRRNRFSAMVSRCDIVIAGNDYLAEAVKAISPTTPVTIIPTCVDPDRYPQATHQPGLPVRLVWVGSSSTLQGLERFRDVLETIGREVPGVRLKLICDRFLSFDSLPVDAVTWDEATEGEEIATADIGIGWVPDDPWSRGKCGLKILQYQAAGLPVIANPVGVQERFVVTGKTGYAATSTEEWLEAVRSLVADPNLRRRLGQAGRTQVRQQYSVAEGGRQWRAILASLTDRQPCRQAG